MDILSTSVHIAARALLQRRGCASFPAAPQPLDTFSPTALEGLRSHGGDPGSVVLLADRALDATEMGPRQRESVSAPCGKSFLWTALILWVATTSAEGTWKTGLYKTHYPVGGQAAASHTSVYQKRYVLYSLEHADLCTVCYSSVVSCVTATQQPPFLPQSYFDIFPISVSDVLCRATPTDIHPPGPIVFLALCFLFPVLTLFC